MKQESLDNQTFNSIIEDCMISITQVDEASKLLCTYCLVGRFRPKSFEALVS